MYRFAVIAFLASLLPVSSFAQGNGKLQIHYMDVGNGEAAVLISPSGEVVLLDGGPLTECAKPIAYLRALGVSTIDYHIATELSDDYIGCAPELLATFPLRRAAYDRGAQESGDSFAAYARAVGIKRVIAQDGGTLTLDAGTTPLMITFVAPGDRTSGVGRTGLGALVRFGQFDAAFGDVSPGSSPATFGSSATPHVEVSSVPYRADRLGSFAAWLATTRPRVGIVSVGAANATGDPSLATLLVLHDAGVNTYWTSIGNGARPVAGRDVVAGNIQVLVSPGAATFGVQHGGVVATYSNWEPIATAVATELIATDIVTPPPGVHRRTSVAASGAAATDPPRVHLLYLIPQDRPYRADYAAAIKNALLNLRAFYAQQLGGPTFTPFASDPLVCQLPSASAYYGVDTWDKLFADVQRCAPVSYASPTATWILYADVNHNCNAAGRIGAGTTGLTMLGRMDLDGLVGARVFGDCGEEQFFGPGRYIGGLGHELGHALGLPHPPGCDTGSPLCDYGALMWAGYASYPNTYFRPDEKKVLLASPFIYLPLSTTPFGVMDTPSDNAVVSGSIGVTGWAVDDSGILAVDIYRSPVPGEATQPNGLVFVGRATHVSGARPDVVAAYPLYPGVERAGWGYLVLTNMFPGRGNGTFTIAVYARTVDGATALIGSRTVVVANAASRAPFGAIDTPGQGETVSGLIINFGWVLTPPPNQIPVNGSTIDVYIDNIFRGHPTYNNFRPDVAALFPDHANANGAIGYFMLDTRTLPNGLHTISWTAVDNAGNIAGFGSRYFAVANAASMTNVPVSTLNDVVLAAADVSSDDTSTPCRISAAVAQSCAHGVVGPWCPSGLALNEACRIFR